eukprot:scaffold4015_cov200-Skeletonema_marinoi.AAC.11
MDDATFTSDTAAMKRRRLLELLAIIRSLYCKESSADDDGAAAVAARNRNVVEGRAREGVRLINDQMAAVSTELLLTVMSDMMLLRLLDGLGLEEGRAVPSSDAASVQQLMDDAAVAKKMKRAAAAAAKKKRNKRNKAAAKHKKTKLMSWKGGGLISLIMMIAFGSITTLIFPLSLIHPSDGSGEGNTPPALPPSASKSLRQSDHRSNYDESDSSVTDIISPLPAVVVVVPPPIFSPIFVGNRRMKSDEMRASSTCVDTPGWTDYSPRFYGDGRDCGWYENSNNCPSADKWAGNMGSAKQNCCICGGRSSTCEDFRSKCQKYISNEVLGSEKNSSWFEGGVESPLCKKAESFCCEAADHNVKTGDETVETVGLYNECKCDFWSRLCEDTEVGEACVYAAEYCCGDYRYYKVDSEVGCISFLSSPTCYCDIFNFTQIELGHSWKWKPKALAQNIREEFENPCSGWEGRNRWDNCIEPSYEYEELYMGRSHEKRSLDEIYDRTNGQNWTNNAGWLDGGDDPDWDYCEWHGISCDGDKFVTSIDLRDNNLEGQFPMYTYNDYEHSRWKFNKIGLANLYSLKTLYLANNKLTGTIDYRPLYNLASLTHFDVSGNQISGEVNALVSPSLAYADFSNNLFTSMHRFEKYKGSFQKLRFCDVSNNAIQSSVTDILESIPPNIKQFIASNNQFYGSLPESFNNLPELRQFDMSSNALAGSLPESLNNLPALLQFDMSSNSLSGKLPDFAESISILQELDLSNQKNTNGFTGPIPKDIWRFESLKILNLAGNNLTGTIPATIGDMTVLEVFDLSSNLLTGLIPSELGKRVGILKRLGLADNDLTGMIPSQLGQLRGATILLKEREVKDFDLASDPTYCQIERNALVQFYDSTRGAEWTDGSLWLDEDASYCDWKGVTCNEKGSIPAEIDSLSYLTYLRLSSNAFTGTIPAGKIPEDNGLLSKLTYLGLNYNAFTGSIPEDIWRSQSLEILNLAGNKLAGTIPPTIGNMTVLEELDLSSNSLSGQIPFQIGQHDGAGVLKRLDLANNILSGTIPSQLGQLQNASILLEGNRFNNSAKTAPLSLCMLRSVEAFDLAYDMTFCPIERNALSDFYDSANGTGWANGTLWLDEYISYCDWTGVTCEQGQHVTELNLTNNGLSGRLSKSIGNLTFIEVLDLSDNDIKGSIPTEIGQLSKITHLRLSSNAINGSIPGELGRFLKIMNLAGNKLTGSIPADLGRYQSLNIMNLAGNMLVGTIPPAIGDMTVLEVLELSSNSLLGQIPFQIGQLEGTLERLDLSSNTLSGTIPSQIGQLQGASVLLEGNVFDNKTAPLSLCMLRSVEAFDLAYDMTFCPIERNALSDFYDSAKGAEWTDRTNWLGGDEYTSYCDWKGVTCKKNRVTELNLSNNGLSGRLSESIGNLTFIEVLDLSDNDIKGSIPTEIGLLSKLTYLRLSYNAFTGAAPESLVELTQLQLLQLQTNRITKIPNMPQLDENESIYNESTFVTDCGVPSAFDEALACKHCNANEDCYPQEETQVAEWGFDYSGFAALLISCFIALCCMVALSLYLFRKRKNRGNALTTSTEKRLEEDDKYALSRIGNESVYSYFVTDKVLGWIVAFATLGIQIGLLFVFVVASEANLQDDAIDIQFTWKCPRDSDLCKDTADLAKAGWFIFFMLMIANLAKDMISGSKLIYHSSKVSTIYNKAIATSNTEIIVNSVVVLFVMDLDEWIFAALKACNEKWTEHAADAEDSSSEAEKGGAIDEMKDKIVLQDAQIADQQKELMRQKEQIEQMARRSGELTELQEAVQNMQDSLAGSSASFETETIFYCDPNANESSTSHADAVESEDAQMDAYADAKEGGKMTMNGTKMRNHYRKIKLGIRRGRPSKLNASSSGYTQL